MILQNIYEENKIFIDDEVLAGLDGVYSDGVIKNINLEYQTVYFKEEEMLTSASRIDYDIEEDHIILYSNDEEFLEKAIAEDELLSLSIYNDMTVITSVKLPKFLSEKGLDDEYPKFEINISDCVYSMKIYLNEYEYIDIPHYQSHNNVHSTLDHISKLTYFLSNSKPLLNNIVNNNCIEITIYNTDVDFDTKQFKGHGVYDYKLAENGIALFGDEFENGVYIVEWQKFFKLIMDTTWEVNFINE